MTSFFVLWWIVGLMGNVAAVSDHQIVYAWCTKWEGDSCPLISQPSIVENYVTPHRQTLCKAEITASVQQIDWLSKGKGSVSSLRVNGHELLDTPIFPSDSLVPPPKYPKCEQWSDCFDPKTMVLPGSGSKRSIIDVARKNSISLDVNFSWNGVHQNNPVCSVSGVSYAAIARVDYYFEVQEDSLCPGWNVTTGEVCNQNGDCLCSNKPDAAVRPCACKQGFGGQDCKDCDATHFGVNCTSTCDPCLNGGKCNSGVNNDGACQCKDGFDPATRCAACLPLHFGPTCQACPSCNFPHGNCVDGLQGNGQCACAVGWDIKTNCTRCMENFYGPDCKPCDPCGTGKCNSALDGDGECTCDIGFDPSTRCTECLDGYFGKDCNRCENCHGHGVCRDKMSGDGGCDCEKGYSSSSRCLRCDVGWDFNPSTMQCQCAPEHFGPDCISCPICAPHGRCNAGMDGDGSCICDEGWSNSNNCVGCMNGYFSYTCQPCRHCGGHGKCDDGLKGSGRCICHRGWNSEGDCRDCAAGYYGESCTSCPQDCGHGNCSSGTHGTGKCLCESGWDVNSSEPCTTCLSGHMGADCKACPGLLKTGIPCSGHGVCSEKNGLITCKCDARYSGRSCSEYDFPVIMVTILGAIALTTLGVCMCTMRRLARGPRSNGHYGPGFNRADYVEISAVSDLELFVSADSKDWVIPFESLTLQYEVGNGTSGQVFRSVYHSGGGSSIVAVKRLYSPVTGQEYFQNFFRREVTILSKLHHPNVVRFYGVSYYSRILYIVTDFCPASLSQLIESSASTGPFESNFYLKIATQITSGMGFLHSRNVVHRDLKPANVLLNDSDDVNICDFGLSRLIDPESTSMTAEVGTPSYMAPEMAQMGGIQCSTKGDVYSFGILLYSLWTRSKPYGDQGMNPFQLMTAVVNGLRPVVPINCPPALAKLMRSCWDSDPDSRPSFPEISLQLKDTSLLFIEEQDVTLPPRRRKSTAYGTLETVTSDSSQ